MSDFTNIASAPGDLRPEAVATRYLTIREQFRHENTISPVVPGPNDSVTVTAVSGSGVPLVAATLTYTVDGSRPDESSPVLAMERSGVEFVPFGGPATKWTVTIPPQPAGTRVRYRIAGTTEAGATCDAQDGHGFWFRYPVEQSVSTFAYRVGVDPSGPDWMQTAVVYQVFLDRFHPGDGQFAVDPKPQARHGGTIAGITASLDYLQELGVTCVWVSPVGPAPSYHNYDATDYFSVDPGYGTVDDVRKLGEAARARGMRLILDFVPSHFSRDHEAFQDALARRDSDYADWFIFYDWPDSYRSFLEVVPQLVSLNTDNDGVREYLIRSARFWLDAGFDGLRLDHVIGHGSDFWCEFQEELEKTHPEVATIGEATDTTDALLRYAGKITGILDFPVAQALRRTFATGDWTLAELNGYLAHFGSYMRGGPGRVGFADNHDMDRFLHLAGGDTERLKMALLCLMTLSPAPVLYYGTEIGMTHEKPLSDRAAGGDELCRQDMIWDESMWDRDLRTLVKGLISLRKKYQNAIIDGERETRFADASGMALGYRVSGAIDVWFNLTDRPVRFAGAVGDLLLSTGSEPDRDETGFLLPPRTGLVTRV